MLWTLPIVGGLLGWLTNMIAVKMLFRPRRAVNLGLFKLRGLIPKSVSTRLVGQTLPETLELFKARAERLAAPDL